MDPATRRLPRNKSTAPIIDHVLKPILRAYAFGHASETGPKLIGLLLAVLSGKQNFKRQLESLRYIVSSSLGPFRYPAFCASVVGIYSTLSLIFIGLLRQWSLRASRTKLPAARLGQIRAARLIAALIATWTAFPMINQGNARYQRQRARSEAAPPDGSAGDPNLIREPHDEPEDEDEDYAGDKFRGSSLSPLAGRTLDLTILASVRAIETLVWHAWRRRYGHLSSAQVSRARLPRSSRLAAFVGKYADSAAFIASSYAIMYAWFYSPDSLPRSYRRWIGQAAGVDNRLVEVLRKAHWGNFIYGVDTGQAYLCEGMCRDLNLPLSWGDPAKTIPVPCEIVHQGTGKSCHYHKVVKFWRVWWFAMRMYLPLQLALRMRKPSLEGLKRAFVEAARSSAFLGSFVTLFYYGVCLSRTVIGPNVFSLDTVSRQDWDSGYCVKAGSALCGWSVLLEPAKRRQELALFVVPRATSVFLPRRYERKYLNRERTAFAIGTSILFTLAHEDPNNVRGLLGSLIHTVIG